MAGTLVETSLHHPMESGGLRLESVGFRLHFYLLPGVMLGRCDDS